jgi:LPXTG-site transpeptidase (sortase) family protein
MSAATQQKGPETGLTHVMKRKWTFLALAVAVFGGTLLGLANLLPNTETTGPAPELTQEQRSGPEVLPETISIPKLNLTAVVANPTSNDPEVLDQNLLYGAVRYPGSGSLGTEGQNVIVFGHSSYLPVVQNQAFKTFDGIQNLAHGDKILVTGAGKTYVYEVETVAAASAQTDGIPLTVSGNKLTLVTCDSFKTKSDRFVVVAHLVESYPTANFGS